MSRRQRLAIPHHPCSVYAPTRQNGSRFQVQSRILAPEIRRQIRPESWSQPEAGVVTEPGACSGQEASHQVQLCLRKFKWSASGSQAGGLHPGTGFSWGQGSVLWSISSCSVSPLADQYLLPKPSAGRPLAGLQQGGMLPPAQSPHYCPQRVKGVRELPHKMKPIPYFQLHLYILPEKQPTRSRCLLADSTWLQ